MLLQLAVENFKSIHKKVVFSMLATNDELHEEYKRNINDYWVLPSSVIIGTNGAGKSNLLMAYKYLQSLINEEKQSIHVCPHILCEKDKPTQIDIQFLIDGIRVIYGIDVVENKVVSECLYTFENHEQNVVFERNFEDYQVHEVSFNEVAKKYGSSTRLFLPILKTYTDDSLIHKVYEFITKKLVIIFSEGQDDHDLFLQAIEDFKEIGNQKIMSGLMNKIDIGIESFEYRENHIFVKYEQMEINLLDESTGTKKLFTLLVLLSNALNDGKVILFDELEKNLHHSLVEYFIYLFNHPVTNPKHAQLIFSTHNTGLLNLSRFRRDQIWFIEKNLKTMTTECYSLYDINDVKVTEDIEKGYILGKYGATYKFNHGGVRRDE